MELIVICPPMVYILSRSRPIERTIARAATVDHVILLRALGSLGIGRWVIDWYRSYLSGRGQRISVRGCTSERFNLDCGVPQGSCLGPLLFSIYTRSLLSIVQDLLPTVHCYTDDNELYVSFSPADENGQSDTITAMES